MHTLEINKVRINLAYMQTSSHEGARLQGDFLGIHNHAVVKYVWGYSFRGVSSFSTIGALPLMTKVKCKEVYRLALCVLVLLCASDYATGGV